VRELGQAPALAWEYARARADVEGDLGMVEESRSLAALGMTICARSMYAHGCASAHAEGSTT